MLPARVFAVLAAAAILAAVSGCASREREREPAPAVAAGPYDARLLKRGEALVALGDCRGCHTAEGGRAFAGGRPIPTPFGTLYSTNITPDPRAGIGAWTEAEFTRAMREGVDRAGRHLYPAFPYDRFTRLTDEDDRAIYAYLRTRPAADSRPPPNRLAFPFNVRAAIGVWKALYFRPGPYRPDPTQDARWNRGAYLAEGVAHCSSCHTPRNKLGAEEAARHLDGGEAEGWHAYAINARSRASVPWTAEAMATYLREGWHPDHGAARGPMAAVTGELAEVPQADLLAIGTYVTSLMGQAAAARRAHPVEDESEGAVLYRTACRDCHDGTRPLPFGGLPLSASIGVTGESPRNLVNVILYGLPAAADAPAPIMPGYAGALSREQVTALARWLRANLTGEPPWADLERVVRAAQASGPAIATQPAGGTGSDPAAPAPRRLP